MATKIKEELKCPHCGKELSLEQARGIYIPTPETADKEFQVDKFGNFRIVKETISSPWTSIGNIATIEVSGKRYIAVHPMSTYARIMKPGVLLSPPTEETSA